MIQEIGTVRFPEVARRKSQSRVPRAHSPWGKSKSPCVKLQTSNRQKKQAHARKMKFLSMRFHADEHTYIHTHAHVRTYTAIVVLSRRGRF